MGDDRYFKLRLHYVQFEYYCKSFLTNVILVRKCSIPDAITKETSYNQPQKRHKKHDCHLPGYLLIAFKLMEASSSDCPPDKNTIPGTAAGTVRCNAVTVAWAFCSGVYLVGQLWPDKEKRTCKCIGPGCLRAETLT